MPNLVTLMVHHTAFVGKTQNLCCTLVFQLSLQFSVLNLNA